MRIRAAVRTGGNDKRLIRRLVKAAGVEASREILEDEYPYVAFDAEGDRVQRVLDVLHAAGRTRCVLTVRGPSPNYLHEYRFGEWAEWEESDFAACELIRFQPAFEVHETHRELDGRLSIYKANLPTTKAVIRAAGETACVPAWSRAEVKAAKLRGIRFEEMVLGRPIARKSLVEWAPWDDDYEPWYELATKVSMPPLPPDVPLADAEGNPLQRRDDFSGGCHIASPRTEPPLRYRRRDLKGLLGKFDLARTFEPFMNRPYQGAVEVGRDRRWYVCTPRFRAFCLKRKWKANWTPVAIED